MDEAALAAILAAAPVKVKEPESTVMALRQVLIDYEAARPRSQQTRLGPSEIGTPCDARLVRKMVGAPAHPVVAPAWAPLQGVAVHNEIEKVLAFWNAKLGRERFLIEQKVEISPYLSGTSDAYDTDTETVIDWKLVGTTALKKLRQARRAGAPVSDQVSPEYRAQAHLYGRGQRNAGRDVKWVRLTLLSRTAHFDDSDEWTEAYDDSVADDAIDRHLFLARMADELGLDEWPEQITAVATAPGEACRWCPYHRATTPTAWASCAGDQSALIKFAKGVI